MITEKFSSAVRNPMFSFMLATTTAMSQVGCVSMTPSQGREIGQGACIIIGGVAGSYITKDYGDWGPLVGAAIGGYGGRQLCGAAAEAFIANQGHCQQNSVTKIDPRTGAIISASGTQKCTQQGPYQGPKAGRVPGYYND